MVGMLAASHAWIDFRSIRAIIGFVECIVQALVLMGFLLAFERPALKSGGEQVVLMVGIFASGEADLAESECST